jgi:phage terminase small subunit
VALSSKQQVFVAEYLKCWNATEAARRAGYAHPNKQGPRLLVNVGISEEIERCKAELMMSADEALIHIGEIARGELGPGFFLVETSEVIEKDGLEIVFNSTGVNWDRVAEYGRLIKSISFTANGPKIELYDRLKALEDIGKAHGLFDRGSEDKPLTVNNINYSVDEWQQEQQRRRAEVTKTLEIFDDETTD